MPQTQDEVRAEGWYAEYFGQVTSTLESTQLKYPEAELIIVGIEPDNHPQYGARTRMEWLCLDEDIHTALRSNDYKGRLKKAPRMNRVPLEDLQQMIKEAQRNKKKRHLIIASCPSRIGDDGTIMNQVNQMVTGKEAVSICYSYAGNAASQVRDGHSGGGHITTTV